MKKKWITKSDIAKILKTYSIRNDEFQPCGKSGYFFQSQIIKGYTISITQEILESKDHSKKTERIIVIHTQYNGKKNFSDIWEHDQSGCLQFRFRNLWNQPLSDENYIKELEEKNTELLQAGQKLQEQLASVQHKPNNSHKLINNTNAESEIIHLRKQIHELEEKYQKLKCNTQVHNARGAGRKPSQERLYAISQVKSLLESGCSNQDIMKQLGFRFKQ